MAERRLSGDPTATVIELFMGKNRDDDVYSSDEANARFEAALRGGLNTPRKLNQTEAN